MGSRVRPDFNLSSHLLSPVSWCLHSILAFMLLKHERFIIKDDLLASTPIERLNISVYLSKPAAISPWNWYPLLVLHAGCTFSQSFWLRVVFPIFPLSSKYAIVMLTNAILQRLVWSSWIYSDINCAVAFLLTDFYFNKKWAPYGARFKIVNVCFFLRWTSILVPTTLELSNVH